LLGSREVVLRFATRLISAFLAVGHVRIFRLGPSAATIAHRVSPSTLEKSGIERTEYGAQPLA